MAAALSATTAGLGALSGICADAVDTFPQTGDTDMLDCFQEPAARKGGGNQ